MFLRLYSIVVFTAVSVASKREVEKGCWPNNVIPYKIEKEFSEEQKLWIRKQISELHRLTCVRWVDISENNLNVTVYAHFTKTTGNICVTQGLSWHTQTAKGYVARVTLSDICFTWGRTVIHEMLHVMGFDHEHQRSDRDCYVEVDEEEVKATGFDLQFKIRPQEEWLERFPYDKRSVMHYTRTTRMRAHTERWYQYEPLGNTDGRLTDLDQWKIRYRFCNGPHYCDEYPIICEAVERAEKDCRKSPSDNASIDD